MRFQNGQPFIRRCGVEHLVIAAARPEALSSFQSEPGIIGALGNPGRMLENAAITRDKGLPVRFGRHHIGHDRLVVFMPVAGDIHTFGHPDLVVALHVIEETFQRRHAAGAPRQTAMQADGHHLGRAFHTSR